MELIKMYLAWMIGMSISAAYQLEETINRIVIGNIPSAMRNGIALIVLLTCVVFGFLGSKTIFEIANGLEENKEEK